MKSAVINNGYYNIKGEGEEIFLSRVKQQDGQVPTKADVIKFEKDKESIWVVGDGKANTSLDKTKDSMHLKLCILNMLARYMGEDKEETFHVYLTAPPQMLKTQRKKISKILKGTDEIIHNGNKKTINVEKVTIVPETVILYDRYSHMVDEDENLYIWDIGGYTSHVVRFGVKGACEIDKDVVTLNEGMYHVDEKILKIIEKDGIKIDENALRVARRKNKLINNRTGEDIWEQYQNDIMEIYEKHVAKIIEKMELAGWGYEVGGEHIITGGGGEILYDAIQGEFPTAKVSEDCIFDNVNSLSRMVKIMNGDKEMEIEKNEEE